MTNVTVRKNKKQELEVYDLQDNLLATYSYFKDLFIVDILEIINEKYAVMEYNDGIRTYEDIYDLVAKEN